jgi:hypothetical protein
MLSFREFVEPKKKTIVISFGRFNPPHRGHVLLFNKMKDEARKRHGDAVLYVNFKQSVPKNPLDPDEKIKYIKMMAPGLDVKYNRSMPDPPDVLKSYSDKGYTDLVVVLGGDRTDKFVNEIKAAIADGTYKYRNFDVVSAGDRGATEMWSATQQRDAVVSDDFRAFQKGLPPNFPEKAARKMFDEVKAGLGIHEDDFDQLEESDDDWDLLGKMDR